MKIQQRERMALAAIGILLVILGLGKFLYQPKYIELSILKKEITELENRIQKVREETGTLYALEKEEKSVQERLTYLEAKFPTERQIPRIVQQLAQEGERYNIDFISIKPKASLPSTNPQALCAELPIEMNIRGRYQDLGEYLGKIRNLPRLITIDKILIQGNEEMLPDLRVGLVVTAYLLKGAR